MKNKMKQSRIKKIWKKEIDERQQAELNRVGNWGYWLAFYLLIGAVVVESIFMDLPFRDWAVEWFVFMILAVYEVIQCLRIGVWSEYKQNPGAKDFLRYSVVGGGIFAAVFTIGSWLKTPPEHRSIPGFAALFALNFVFLLVLLFAGFILIGALLKRRRRMQEERLNEEAEKEEEEEDGI